MIQVNFAILSVVEALYIVYMFNFFRTRYSVHHPFEAIVTQNTTILRHPIATGLYENKICPLGSVVSVAVALFLLIRIPGYTRHPRAFALATKVVFGALVVGTLLSNLNAFLYVLPLVALEMTLAADFMRGRKNWKKAASGE